MDSLDIDGSIRAFGLNLYNGFLSFSIVFLADDRFLVLYFCLLLHEIIGVFIHGNKAALHALFQFVGG